MLGEAKRRGTPQPTFVPTIQGSSESSPSQGEVLSDAKRRGTPQPTFVPTIHGSSESSPSQGEVLSEAKRRGPPQHAFTPAIQGSSESSPSQGEVLSEAKRRGTPRHAFVPAATTQLCYPRARSRSSPGAMRFQHVAIEALVTEVPETVITTASLERMMGRTYQRLGLQPGFLEMLTGIRARRFWDAGVQPSDAATIAARKVLSNTGVNPDDIGILINTSVCKDYLEPSTAALVHGNLGLGRRCLNFDVGNACLGFLSGMTVVANMIELGQIKAGMVVAGEGSRDVTRATVRRLMQPSTNMGQMRDNIATLTLGSASAAMLLVHDSIATTPHRFIGGTVLAATEHNRLCVGTPDRMTTDPTTLLKEGVKLAGEAWAVMQQELGLGHADMTRYALHQVGKANHDAVCAALSVPPDKALRVYPDIGNVGACGVPLALSGSVQRGWLKEGDNAALMGIGSGLNTAMMVVRW